MLGGVGNGGWSSVCGKVGEPPDCEPPEPPLFIFDSPPLLPERELLPDWFDWLDEPVVPRDELPVVVRDEAPVDERVSLPTVVRERVVVL